MWRVNRIASMLAIALALIDTMAIYRGARSRGKQQNGRKRSGRKGASFWPPSAPRWQQRGARTGPVTTVADALRIIGVAAIPDAGVLNKLERIMMERVGEGEKEDLALAFRILKAVQSSSAQPERA